MPGPLGSQPTVPFGGSPTPPRYSPASPPPGMPQTRYTPSTSVGSVNVYSGTDPATAAAASAGVAQAQSTLTGLDNQEAILRLKAALYQQYGGGGGGGGAGAGLANRQADIQIAAARRQLDQYLPQMYRAAADTYGTTMERLLGQRTAAQQGYRQTMRDLAIRGSEARRSNRDQTRAFGSDVAARGASIAPGTVEGYRSLADALTAQLGQVRLGRQGARTGWQDALSQFKATRKGAQTELRRTVAGLMEQRADLNDRIAQLELQKQLNSLGGGGGGGSSLGSMLAQLGLAQELAALNTQREQVQAQVDWAKAQINAGADLPSVTNPNLPAGTPGGPAGPPRPGAAGGPGYQRPDGR